MERRRREVEDDENEANGANVTRTNRSENEPVGVTTVFTPPPPRADMLYDVVDDPASHTAPELRAAYGRALADVVDAHGVERVAADSGVDEDRLRALVAGDDVELTVEEATAVLAVDADIDAETMALELQDRLLMGMTTGVLDVDTLAAETGLDVSGQEVQQSLEGRRATTLDELAAIHRVIAARNDR
jgi:hypothetical protein